MQYIASFCRLNNVFIHNALDELLTCGDTEIAAANNMRIAIGRLSRPIEDFSRLNKLKLTNSIKYHLHL